MIKEILLSLAEVQTLAKLKHHPNIIHYNQAWIEASDSIDKCSQSSSETLSVSTTSAEDEDFPYIKLVQDFDNLKIVENDDDESQVS